MKNSEIPKNENKNIRKFVLPTPMAFNVLENSADNSSSPDQSFLIYCVIKFVLKNYLDQNR